MDRQPYPRNEDGCGCQDRSREGPYFFVVNLSFSRTLPLRPFSFPPICLDAHAAPCSTLYGQMNLPTIFAPPSSTTFLHYVLELTRCSYRPLRYRTSSRYIVRLFPFTKPSSRKLAACPSVPKRLAPLWLGRHSRSQRLWRERGSLLICLRFWRVFRRARLV